MKSKLLSILFVSLIAIIPFKLVSQTNCLPPTGLTTANITLTGAILSWIAPSGAIAYVVQYRPVTTPASTWINVTSQLTSVTLATLTCGTQYEWQVMAYCSTTSGGTSVYTVGAPFTTLVCTPPCAAPTGLTTSNITQTGVTLSWTAVTGVYNYLIQYRPVTTPVATWTSMSSQTTSLTLTSLTCGTQYEWQVATYCGNGIMSTYAAGTSFTTLACTVPCNPPTRLTTTNITLTAATLSWAANSGALTYVIHYRPVTTPVSTWSSVSTQNTTVPLSGLTCGTQYEWQVANYCSSTPGGFSSYSSSVTFTTLACVVTCLPPAGLTTTNITLTGATLSWIAPISSLAYVVQYRPVTTPASAWITVTASTTSVTLSGLNCGTQYEWEVASYCSNSSSILSAYSTPISFTTLACTVPCNPPTGLTTTNITLTNATLSWAANSGALTYVVHYRPVTTPVSSWSSISTQNTSVTLSGLTCGTQYEWQVANYCCTTAGGFSSYSPSVTFTTMACTVPCNPPVGLISSNITQTGVTLSWTAVTGVYNYLIQYRPVTTPASAWISTSSQTTSITLTGLSCGTQYEWQVATYCGSGVMSTYTAGTSFSTLACSVPCLSPAGLSTNNITLTGATLSWTAPAGALAYVVQYRPLTTPASAWITVNATTTSVILSGLSCGNQYEWEVASYCSNTSSILSAYSAPINFITPACIVPCNPPTGLMTNNITLTGATLSWTANSGAIAYVVQYRPVTNPVSAWSSISTQHTTTSLSGLTCGTQYEWQVANYCSTTPGGFSSYSPSVTFTTMACTVPCNPPTELTTTNITLTGATLSWIANIGVLAYIVHYRPVTNPVSAWSSISTQHTTVTVSGLTCGTQYEWQVASYCGTTAGSISSFSSQVNFSTLACSVSCLPPTGLTTTNITLTGATFSWIAPAGALAYVVQYRPITTPASTWITLNTTTSHLILSNLSCGTQYEWQVATYCSNVIGGLSSYSSPISFTTLACTINICAVPTGLTSTFVSTNPSNLMLQWNSTNAGSYNIRYKKVNTAVYTTTISATNSKLVTGLTNGQYEWQVQSICSSNTGTALASPWSATAWFSISGNPVIFPNPVFNKDIHLTLVVETETDMIILITDQFGNTVKSMNKTVTPNTETLDIDVSDLKNGIYFIQINGDNINDFQKMVIMR